MAIRGKAWAMAAIIFIAVLIVLRLLPARLLQTALLTGLGSSLGRFDAEMLFLGMTMLLLLVILLLVWFAPKARPIALSEEGLVPGNVFGGQSIKWADVVSLDVNTSFMAPLLGAYCLDFTVQTSSEGKIHHRRLYAYASQDDIVALFEHIRGRVLVANLTSKAIAMMEAVAEARHFNLDHSSSAGVHSALNQMFEWSFFEALRQMKYLYDRSLVHSQAAVIYAKLAFAQGDFATVREVCSNVLLEDPTQADAARYMKLAEAELSQTAVGNV